MVHVVDEAKRLHMNTWKTYIWTAEGIKAWLKIIVVKSKSLSTELQAICELVTLWVRNIPVEREECKWIYKRWHLNWGERYEDMIDHRSLTPILRSCEIKDLAKRPHQLSPHRNLELIIQFLWWNSDWNFLQIMVSTFFSTFVFFFTFVP